MDVDQKIEAYLWLGELWRVKYQPDFLVPH